MKKKVLLSSILTIALCVSLIAGSTFALFTAKSGADISITAGTVDVLATIDEESLALYSMDVAQQDTFENGGTALFTDASKLALTNITPGDKATFDINVTNNSNVTIQYRVNWEIDGVLAEALVATVDGKEMVTGTTGWTEWAIPANDGEKVRTLSVGIELPALVGNEYQGESAEISFGVVAVQGNGTEDYVPMCDVIATPETIDGVLASVKAGTVIGLAKGTYDKIVLTQNDLTIVTNSAVVGFVNCNATSGAVLDGITFDAAMAQPTYSFRTGNQKVASGYTANVTGDTDVSYGAKNVTIKNCVFTGAAATNEDGSYKFAPIDFEEGGSAGHRASNVTVTNCVFECTNAINMIRMNYMAAGTVKLTYNVFGTPAAFMGHNAINATGNASDWYVYGNTFYNWNTENAAFGSSRSGAESIVNLTFKGNNFVNTGDLTEYNILNIKHNTYTEGTYALAYENNVANYGLYTFAENTVVDGNDTLYKVTSATDKKLTVATGKEAFANGKLENVYIALEKDVEAPLVTPTIYGTPAAVVLKGGCVFDGNGNALIIEDPVYNGYAIETYGGTIKNVVIDTAVGRGIVISAPTEDIYIDNVIVDGPGYALNTTEYGYKALYVTNSTINGWTSLAGLTTTSFTGCKFGENTAKYWQNMGYGQDYDRLIRPYGTATFTNCEFEQGYCLDLSKLGGSDTVTLAGCTVNGVVLTAENYTSYVTVENGMVGTNLFFN